MVDADIEESEYNAPAFFSAIVRVQIKNHERYLMSLWNRFTAPESGVRLRKFVQWAFFFWIIFSGAQFGLFVRHYAAGDTAHGFSRPAGIEGFLPIGALVSFKHWLVNGVFDQHHPAALVLFLTFLGLALLTKNSFCGWICPVGALHDPLSAIGRRLFGRNFRLWRPLDLLLRGFKYLLLLFFLNTILIGMPASAVQSFLASPYWAVADVKMLNFFITPSTLSVTVIAILALLALGLRNFWCRYLCPYGALLGLLSLLSLIKVRRDPGGCTGCQACSRHCPQQIAVHCCTTVHSQECTACLTCISRCPEPDVLSLRAVLWRRTLPTWGFAFLLLGLFAAGVGTGMLSGHWQSVLTDVDYRQLIPEVNRFSH